jgi:hypothetical protein
MFYQSILCQKIPQLIFVPDVSGNEIIPYQRKSLPLGFEPHWHRTYSPKKTDLSLNLVKTSVAKK